MPVGYHNSGAAFLDVVFDINFLARWPIDNPAILSHASQAKCPNLRDLAELRIIYVHLDTAEVV